MKYELNFVAAPSISRVPLETSLSSRASMESGRSSRADQRRGSMHGAHVEALGERAESVERAIEFEFKFESKFRYLKLCVFPSGETGHRRGSDRRKARQWPIWHAAAAGALRDAQRRVCPRININPVTTSSGRPLALASARPPAEAQKPGR